VCLIARALEQAGISTVIMGCVKDIVEYVGAPRFLFSDFPLGNPSGRPHDQESQYLTLGYALDLLANAPGPMTTWQNPIRWSENPSWKEDYSNVEKLSPEEIVRLKAEFDRGKEIAKAKREGDAA
jgi:hypothetical protein